jgi:hypothetical protein
LLLFNPYWKNEHNGNHAEGNQHQRNRDFEKSKAGTSTICSSRR